MNTKSMINQLINYYGIIIAGGARRSAPGGYEAVPQQRCQDQEEALLGEHEDEGEQQCGEFHQDGLHVPAFQIIIGVVVAVVVIIILVWIFS